MNINAERAALPTGGTQFYDLLTTMCQACGHIALFSVAVLGKP